MTQCVKTRSRALPDRLIPLTDAAEGLRCLVLVTRSQESLNGNGRRYTPESLRQAVYDAQERVSKRLMACYYRHPAPVINAETGEPIGFDYTQNPAVAFVESLEWDDSLQEAWAIIQFYAGDPVADWLSERIRGGEMLPVSLRALGQCVDDTNGQTCTVAVSDGFDILEPAEGDIPAMADAGIKAILDCQCQSRQLLLNEVRGNMDERIEARIRQLHEMGVSWDVVEQVLSWDWGISIDMEAARMLFESLTEPGEPVEDTDLQQIEMTQHDACSQAHTGPDALTDNIAGHDLSIAETPAISDIGASRMSQPITDTIQARLSALDEIIREREEQKRREEFERKVAEKLSALTDATDAEKSTLHKLALSQSDSQAGMVILDHEIAKLIEAKRNQALADEQRTAMGFVPETPRRGHTISVGTASRPYMDVLDKLDAVIQDNLAVRASDGQSGRQRAEHRQERRRLLSKSENLKKYFTEFEAKNYHALCDAVTSSDVHGVSTAKNRETLLNLAILREQFYMSTVIESLVQPLMPNSQFVQPFRGGSGLAADQSRLGGVFVIPLEYVSESSRARAKFYRPERNVGAVELVNTQVEHNVFATRARRAAAVFDYENMAQLLTGALNLDIVAEATMQIGAALARSIDSEAIFTMLNDSREHEAVQKTGENVAATEWDFNAGGGAGGYGANVIGRALLLGPFAAGTLEGSVPAGANKSPILVYPRTKTYVNGLTGDTVDHIPYDITMTLPGPTTPVLGYLDPDDLQVKPLVEGQTPTHAVDPMAGALVFTAASNVTLANRPTAVSYWYATNYSTWSRSQGLWDVASASYPNPFPAGTTLPNKARAFVELVSEFGGELYEERNRYPEFALQKFGFGNGYTAKSATFEKQISPTDAELFSGYGAGSVIGQDAGIVHTKTANPQMPSTVLLGQRGATFYGLGYVFGLRNQNMDVAPTSGGLVQPANGEYYLWGQLDAIGTPRFSDGRNFPYYEIVIID